MERYYIGRMGVSIVDMDQVLHQIIARVQENRPAYVCVANTQATVLAQRDAEFCRIQNHSMLTVPDGMPLIWYAQMAGVRNIQRVTGPDLMNQILTKSGLNGWTHYFYGDTEETLQHIQRVVHERFAGVTIVGTQAPPFRSLTDQEVNRTIHEINRLHPSIVWVGLGSPKQERWISRVFPRIDSSILIGVGAAFRFLIGEYRHPPRAIQNWGLEGLFWRVRRRPVYCARWYAYHIPAFGYLMLRGLVSRGRGRRCSHP